MLGKGKEMTSRYPAPSDGLRLFNKALELLASNTPESEHELLELVKKAKKDTEKDAAPPFKKVATGRSGGESSELGHRSIVVPAPVDHAGGLQASFGLESGHGNSTNPGLAVTPVAVGHTQARLLNVARSGSGRGRVEKPKRKIASQHLHTSVKAVEEAAFGSSYFSKMIPNKHKRRAKGACLDVENPLEARVMLLFHFVP